MEKGISADMEKNIPADMEKNISQTLYFSLLRAAIWGSEPVLPDVLPEDLSDVIALSLRQGTAPLVFNQMLKQPLLMSRLTDKQKLQLKQICMSNMLEQQKLLSVLRRTWSALEQGGVFPVCLKGFGLSVLYPQPYLRVWGDLDVYVGPSQYHKAAALLRDAFPDAGHHEDELEELKHYNFTLPEGALVEMHRTSVKLDHPRDIRTYFPLEDAAVTPQSARKVTAEDMEIAVPEDRFNVLFTFYHAWDHCVTETGGMKQVCDVVLLVHAVVGRMGRQPLEAYLRPVLRKMGLMQPWRLFGYLAVGCLGLKAEEWPLYDDSRWTQRHGARFLAYLLSREPVARAMSEEESRRLHGSWNVVYRKLYTFFGRTKDARDVWPYAPSYAWHMFCTIVLKGLRRIIRREGVIPY